MAKATMVQTVAVIIIVIVITTALNIDGSTGASTRSIMPRYTPIIDTT